MISFFVLVCVALAAWSCPTANAEFHCPIGEKWINGKCRIVWQFRTQPPKYSYYDDYLNTRPDPPLCPHGQEWIVGACRDGLWFIPTRDEEPIKHHCPHGTIWVNGACQLAHGFLGSLLRGTNNINIDVHGKMKSRRITTIPKLKCPPGYRRDSLGVCRKIFR